jgi:hypothetical protein
MESVAELEQGKYERKGDVSILTEPISGGRTQVVYGKVRKVDQEDVGYIFTIVGPWSTRIEPENLLKLNYHFKNARIALAPDNNIVIIAFFDLQKTSAQQAIEIIKEVANMGDGLEKRIFTVDSR